MLQGVKAQISHPRSIRMPVDGDHAAFLMQRIIFCRRLRHHIT
jgi:hypothetical protein